ncbi:L,D-transpeptidase [Sphaerisporangium corydalis]|uniref:L,D-transpeptidase n=1 Tax=Sphaerisporangium corydalis TaxID=1441875 RepID=A0ABV9EF27_9ACTN|nr:L,D-transpeptidase [Sphaerisporangium corydalis]
MYLRQRSLRTTIALIAVVAAALTGLVLLVVLTNKKVDRELARPPAPPAPPAKPVAPVKLTSKQIAALPLSTTWTKIARAEPDPQPFAPNDGLLLHPQTSRVVYAEPGGPAIAMLPTTQLDNPTWLPVIESRPEWARVLLPSRPNGSTGWIYTGAGKTKESHSPYQVRIDLTARRLNLLKDGQQTGSWPVAIGTKDTPTPVGRTFLLASLSPPEVTYSPVILPLGMHSEKLQTFDGGPGTVGLHGWPDTSAFGHAVSHGCVRLPKPALDAISHIPLGTLIIITR